MMICSDCLCRSSSGSWRRDPLPISFEDNLLGGLNSGTSAISAFPQPCQVFDVGEDAIIGFASSSVTGFASSSVTLLGKPITAPRSLRHCACFSDIIFMEHC